MLFFLPFFTWVLSTLCRQAAITSLASSISSTQAILSCWAARSLSRFLLGSGPTVCNTLWQQKGFMQPRQGFYASELKSVSSLFQLQRQPLFSMSCRCGSCSQFPASTLHPLWLQRNETKGFLFSGGLRIRWSTIFLAVISLKVILPLRTALPHTHQENVCALKCQASWDKSCSAVIAYVAFHSFLSFDLLLVLVQSDRSSLHRFP